MVKTIREEIKQTRPFGSDPEQAIVNLMRTCRVLEEPWVSYIRRTEGISLSQYNVLRILQGAKPQKLRVNEISDRMINHDPDVTRLVDRMVRQGLASRVRSSEDRRVVLVSITQAGSELLQRLAAPVLEWADCVMAGLNLEKLREFNSLLDQARAGAAEFP